MVGARGAWMGPRARDTVTIGPLVLPAVDMILATAISGPNSSFPNQGVNVAPANSGSGVFGLSRASIEPASLSYQGGAGAGAISYLRIEGRPNVTVGQFIMQQPGMTVPVIVSRLARNSADRAVALPRPRPPSHERPPLQHRVGRLYRL